MSIWDQACVGVLGFNWKFTFVFCKMDRAEIYSYFQMHTLRFVTSAYTLCCGMNLLRADKNNKIKSQSVRKILLHIQ